MKGTPTSLRLVKFQQRNEKRHGNLLNLLCAMELCLRGAPKISGMNVVWFWEPQKATSHWLDVGLCQISWRFTYLCWNIPTYG